MHRLSFCSISVIGGDTAEIILNSGVEITLEMVDEFLRFIASEMGPEISVILNKATKYSYRFDALVKLSLSKSIKNIAVVSYDELSTSMSKYMRESFNKSGKNIEIFESREKALAWLKDIS